MSSFNEDITTLARKNTFFRQVVVTGTHSQVVLMNIPPGGEIGEETHPATDQTLIFVTGQGQAILNGAQQAVGPNSLCFVAAGTRHNFVNTGTTDLQLYTLYAPPQHAPGTIHKTKADADAAERDARKNHGGTP